MPQVKEIFEIAEGEIPYLDANPKLFCKIEMERCVEFGFKDHEVICKAEIFFTPRPGTSNWFYKIGLEIYISAMKNFLKIESFNDFKDFLMRQYNEAPHKLNNHAITHEKKDQKLHEVWVAWNKIFKPRLGNILKKPISYPPVYR